MTKILIIEDDFAVRSSINELLNEEGFETYEAENGRIGIDIAKEVYPDLIISDILMPEVDGYGVLQELQKEIHTSSIPFIFLSARTEASDIREGMREGADDYLTKPYKAVDLLDAVNSRLSKKNKIDKRLNQIFKSIALSLPHKLRSPLVSILGYSQIIKEDQAKLNPAEINDMAVRINTSGYELLNMIEKFLLFSNLESLCADNEWRKNINNSNTRDIKKIISAIASYTAIKFERASEIKIKLIDASIRISQDHFELLISEIIENAFKFSKKGTFVEIKSEIIDGFYFLEISDKGIGMLPEQIKAVGALRQFDRSKNKNGMGLGLSIVNKIVEIYELGIKIESKYQDSTKIKIFIPIENNDRKYGIQNG
jgi:DNA-binding response OmpR family regulator